MKHTVENRILFLPPEKISIPKEGEKADPYRILLLSESIRENGLVVPVTVRRTSNGYMLINGKSRVRAALLAGLRKIPCTVTGEKETELLRAMDNKTGKEENPFLEARTLYLLTKKYSPERIAAALSISTGELNEKLRILSLPSEIKNSPAANLLTAKALSKLCDLSKEDQTRLIQILENPILARCEVKPIQAKPSKRSVPTTDPRFFVNSVRKLADRLQNGGTQITLKQNETERFTEIKIKIAKPLCEVQLPIID